MHKWHVATWLKTVHETLLQIITDISNSTPLKLTSSDQARHHPRETQPQPRRAGNNVEPSIF